MNLKITGPYNYCCTINKMTTKKDGIIYDGVNTNFSLLERKGDADDI